MTKVEVIDAMGNLTSKLDEDGLETRFAYDPSGNLTQVQYADGKTVRMRYSPLKQLTELQDWLGTTKIEHDALGCAARIPTSIQGCEEM